MNTRARAFTVVDLTVAIAVIALLILIATPVIAGSRLTSRLVMDLANLWQHAVMKDNFVAANKGRMPNAPPGRDRLPSGANTGPAERPARYFALEGFEHNGWTIPGRGIQHDDVHRNYHITFGDYLVEGQGVDMLQEVFISNGADPLIDVAANWEGIRSNEDGLYPAAFENTDVDGAAWLSSDPTSDRSEAWRLNPGYRYTIAGIYGQHELCEDWDFWLPRRNCFHTPGIGFPWYTSWTFYRFFRGEAEFRLPSGKVMFYAPFADHNLSADVYTQMGAEVPVVMVDGSARISRPAQEMPDPLGREYLKAQHAGELWAAPNEIRWRGRLPVTVLHPFRPAWFFYTRGGPAGYDFRPGTQTAACRWDYSEDNNVNSSDLATLLAGDGRPVRSSDLAQLLSSWGLCNQ